MTTHYKGIDYGMGKTNIDTANGIRYGVISQHCVLQAWCDSSEPYYGKPDEAECPECRKTFTLSNAEWGDTVECKHCEHRFDIELPDFAEPISHFIDNAEISAECGESGDIFISKSLYYTRAQFCSPCAPGACHLEHPMDDGEKAYCFGHDWFDEGKAPYPVYSVKDDALVAPSK